MAEVQKPLTQDEICEILGSDESIPVSELAERRPEAAKALAALKQVMPAIYWEEIN